MKLGAEDKKKAIIAGIAGLLALSAVGYTANSLFGGAAPPPPSAPIIVDNTHPTANAASGPTAKVTATPPGYAVAGTAQKVGTTSGQLDPTLHEEAMLNTESLVYSGTGRNIFSGIAEAPAPKPVVIPKPVSVARTQPVATLTPQQPLIQAPPPINLKFFGTSTSASGEAQSLSAAGRRRFPGRHRRRRRAASTASYRSRPAPS